MVQDQAFGNDFQCLTSEKISVANAVDCCDGKKRITFNYSSLGTKTYPSCPSKF